MKDSKEIMKLLLHCIDIFKLNSERLKNLSFRDMHQNIPFNIKTIEFPFK